MQQVRMCLDDCCRANDRKGFLENQHEKKGNEVVEVQAKEKKRKERKNFQGKREK